MGLTQVMLQVKGCEMVCKQRELIPGDSVSWCTKKEPMSPRVSWAAVKWPVTVLTPYSFQTSENSQSEIRLVNCLWKTSFQVRFLRIAKHHPSEWMRDILNTTYGDISNSYLVLFLLYLFIISLIFKHLEIWGHGGLICLESLGLGVWFPQAPCVCMRVFMFFMCFRGFFQVIPQVQRHTLSSDGVSKPSVVVCL